MGRFFPGRFALARKRAHLPNPLIKTVEILSGTVEASLRDDKSYFKFVQTTTYKPTSLSHTFSLGTPPPVLIQTNVSLPTSYSPHKRSSRHVFTSLVYVASRYSKMDPTAVFLATR